METRMRGGDGDEHSLSMPSWMEEDAPSDDDEENPNLDPDAEGPIDDQEEALVADHQNVLGMVAGDQPGGIPLLQPGVGVNEPLEQPRLEHPAQLQRQRMPNSGCRFLR
jgi:hypothetical protein